MFWILLASIIVIYMTLDWLTKRPKNYPPGPPCLPIVGSLPFLPTKHIHVTMAGEWRKKYGPLVGLVMGNKTMVAVCGPREVMEVLKREEFQGRPKGPAILDRSFNKYLGVFFSDGGFWLEQRRFTLRHLRDFGFGKKSMEDLVMEEVEDVLKEMARLKICQADRVFAVSTLNVLWGMLAGQRYSRDDAALHDLLEKLARAFRSGNPTGGVYNIFPFLKHIIPGPIGYTIFKESLTDIQNFLRNAIKEHEKTIDEDNPRDFTDVYLKETRLQADKPNTTFTEEGLIIIGLDLFAAGGETTMSSLAFSLLYMVNYPEVQRKVQKELDDVVGRSRRPNLQDRPNLHYMEAVMTELLRVASIAPLAVPHRATSEAYLNGYLIPKDTTLLINLYSLFQDKEHWGDPEAFRPERFLDSNGKFVKDEWMIAFGAGKRICLGEVLARTTVYLFFSSIVQEFTLSIPEGDPRPSEVPLPGFTIAPKPFRVQVTKRF